MNSVLGTPCRSAWVISSLSTRTPDMDNDDARQPDCFRIVRAATASHRLQGVAEGVRDSQRKGPR